MSRFRKLKHAFRHGWLWLRFGTISERVVAYAGDYIPAEIEYRGRHGRVVGYWAYGAFDPAYPYQG